MNKKIRLILFTTIVVLCVNVIKAQVCGTSNLPINKLVDEITLVVTGKVIDQHCFWNDTKTNIYTNYTIKVAQSSKDSKDEIQVIAEGGTIDNINMEVFGLPNLTLQNEGVFFLNKDDNNFTINKNHTCYNLLDIGWYDNVTNTIQNNNSTITVDEFNKQITKKSNTTFSFKEKNTIHYKTAQANITGINPKLVAAGNNEILTITGNGFGNLTGNAKISMRSAGSLSSSAFIDINKANIKTWTNTKIQFVVPGDEITFNFPGVASGKIRVTNNAGSVTTSFQKVEVSYNKKLYDGKPIRVRSKNSAGEIPFYVERELINDGALSAIQNALEMWNCTTGSNFTYAGIVENICREYDEINVICYDATVPTFNLAITKVVSRNCSATNVADQIDADITFNPNMNWGFNDNLASGQFHFESVLLHELGHAFMLSHVVNEDDVMYPSLRNGLIKNDLTNNDINGGLDVLSESTSMVNCSNYGPVVPYGSGNCSGCNNVVNVKANNITENSVYLTWDNIRNSVSYNMRYRFSGSTWYKHKGKNNSLILYNLPSCTTIECRFSAFCSNNLKSENEIVYRFITYGCH